MMQPLLDSPPPVHPYEGNVGPGGGRQARRRPRQLARAVGRRHDARSQLESRLGLEQADGTRSRPRAPRRPRRSRRSPTTRSSPTATPARCVAPDGAIEWLCVPRFDSPSVFGTLLDRGAGTFRLGPFGINVPTARVVRAGDERPDDDVADAERLARGPRRADHGPAPAARTRSRRTPGPRPTTTPTTCWCAPCVPRRVSVEIELVCEPVFDYGRERRPSGRWSTATGTAPTPAGAGQTLRLRTDMALGIEGSRVRARHVLRAGRAGVLRAVLGRGAGGTGGHRRGQRAPGRHHALLAHLAAAAPGSPDHRWREPIQRSALAIKGLTYMPTGATVAALTTSLPETPGGERNWDYRYTWMRDSTFTLQALHWLNLDWEADEFMQFVADLEPNEDGALQIMYGIDGRRDLTESTRDDLSGYAGAQPVRIGNGAFDQRQNDVFGAVLDSILLHTRRSQRLPRRLWPIVEAQAECATSGLARARTRASGRRAASRSTTSRPSSCAGSPWTAPRSWRDPRRPELQDGWRATAEEIKRGHPRPRSRRPRRPAPALRHRRARRLDAAGGDLRLPARGRRAPARQRPGHRRRPHRARATSCATRPTRPTTAWRGKEGTFLICSFWLVSALAIIGEIQRARDLMERLLRVASPLGLYAEEFDADTGRHLGNFPQAFSHLALIEAAARIILAERLEELG